jgi:hypothetical protein
LSGLRARIDDFDTRCARRPRVIWCHGLIPVAVLVLGWVVADARAYANPIAGATYAGVASDRAGVDFTLSPDGTLVTAYQITGALGSTCALNANGNDGVWEGAPIVSGAFVYRIADLILFRGSFAGPRSASGTFRLHNRATRFTPACDTGIVTWTATTTAAPLAGSGGRSGVATRVVLRRLSQTRLGGRINTPSGACRAARAVILWRGSRRIARTKSNADGTFSFVRSPTMRGHIVRASVLARPVRRAICTAGSSTFISA